MQRPSKTIALLAILSMVLSCGDESEETVAAGEGTAPPYRPPEPSRTDVRPPADRPEADQARFRVSRGQVEVGRRLFAEGEDEAPASTLGRGDRVPSGRRIRATGGAAALDGLHDVRVELEPDATGFVLEESPLGVALLSGGVVAAVPPRGGTTPSPLRVATPAATLVIAGAGEAYIFVLGPGSVWASAVSGRLGWSGPSAADDTREIVSGQAVLLSAGGEAVVRPGPASVDEARRQRPEPRVNRDSGAVQEWLVAALRELDAAVAESTEVSAAGAALTKAIRERDDNGRAAADIRGQAVAHGQRRLAIRARLLAGWEHALVLASREGAEQALLRERRQSVRSWLGF